MIMATAEWIAGTVEGKALLRVGVSSLSTQEREVRKLVRSG